MHAFLISSNMIFPFFHLLFFEWISFRVSANVSFPIQIETSGLKTSINASNIEKNEIKRRDLRMAQKKFTYKGLQKKGGIKKAKNRL